MTTVKRKVRFQSESSEGQFDLELNGPFQGKYAALVINESYSGACLVARNDFILTEQMELRVKVGNLSPLLARIVWIEKVDDDILKFGIEYRN